MQVLVISFLFLVGCSYVISTPIPETAESARIVNGYAVNINDVPYQASIRRKVLSGWAHFCGAVLISTKGVLTAAHCVQVYDVQPSLLRVSVGTEYRLSGGKTYDVSLVIVHEKYSSTTLENDIALLGTTKTMSFGQSVSAIAIASQHYELPVGTEAIVSGFGTTSFEGSSSEVLLAARVKIVAQEICARAYLRIGNIATGMVCANNTNPARDACQGDSGGPLVAGNVLVGIVSWGEGCASTQYPGVYTRVSEYSSWIWQNLATVHQSKNKSH